ncbi:MAG: hypothetical protein LBK41_01245 [Clostridiales bacterium]|nr:hypothetical protein [Clostridiales bacterium]
MGNFVDGALRTLGSFSVPEWIMMMFAAYFLTRFALWAEGFIRFLFSPIDRTNFEDGEYDRAFARCCMLFPIDFVRFGNKTFTRGTMVRVTTTQGKNRVGKLVGSNKEHFICLITSKFVSAELIENVTDIIAVDDLEASE